MPNKADALNPATTSRVSALVFAVVVFVSGAAIKSFGDALCGVVVSCWVALPLLLLGVIKLFRAFPATHVVLLALGILASVFAAASPYGYGSTSALGLVVLPFYVVVVYVLVAFVLLCVKTYSK